MPVPASVLDEKAEVTKAIASLPKIFGLRSFPMEKFRINEKSSYYSRSDNSVQIVIEKLTLDGWKDFTRESYDRLLEGGHVVPVR